MKTLNIKKVPSRVLTHQASGTAAFSRSSGAGGGSNGCGNGGGSCGRSSGGCGK